MLLCVPSKHHFIHSALSVELHTALRHMRGRAAAVEAVRRRAERADARYELSGWPHALIEERLRLGPTCRPRPDHGDCGGEAYHTYWQGRTALTQHHGHHSE